MVNSRTKVGLALGCGGALGFAHVGVLKVLHKHRVPIDVIAGGSIGAIAGSAYAAGLEPLEIERILLSTNMKSLFTRFDGSLQGLISTVRIAALIRRVLGDIEFQHMQIPLAIVALDLKKEERVILKTGKVVPALQASMAIPLLFAPVRIGGRCLADPGIINSIPIDVPFQMRAHRVIGVSAEPEKPPAIRISEAPLRQIVLTLARIMLTLGFGMRGNIVGYLPHVLRILASPQPIYEPLEPSLILKPKFRGMSRNAYTHDQVLRAIEAGEAVAQEALPRILDFLSVDYRIATR